MEQRSDAELLEITTKLRDDYQPEALEAAEYELKKRNLSQEQIINAEKEIEIKNNEILNKENAPLQIYWKILTFIFPAILNLVIAGTFKADGYNKRFKDAWKWTFYGFGFYVVVIIIIFLISSFLPIKNTSDNIYCDCNDLLQDSIENIWYYENLAYTGKCISYNKQGIKESESEFCNGKMHGITAFYYGNGNIMEQVEWENGQPDGKVIYYYKNGDTSEYGLVEKGEKVGVWKSFYDNGNIMTIEKWQNNFMVDSSVGYFENGNIELKGFWIDGKANGIWTFYDSITGQIDGYMRYENDSVIEIIEKKGG